MVRKRAMPNRIWLGGLVPVPNACLSSDKTIMIRVKLVIISRIDGNRVRTVIKPSSCNVTEYSVSPVWPCTALKIGMVPCAEASVADKNINKSSKNLSIRPPSRWARFCSRPRGGIESAWPTQHSDLPILGAQVRRSH